MSLNVIGFYTYSLYTLKSVSLISQSDKIFAIHAFILSIFVLLQFIYFHGMKWTQLFFLLSILVVTNFESVGILGLVKLGITVCKYIPQIYENYTRESTKGFSTTGVALDLSGGLLSMLQLFYDGYILNLALLDVIFGNSTKLGLSLVTIFMDVVLLIQAKKYSKNILPTEELLIK